jgi:type IV secretory pathway VirB10-like protein
MTSTQKIIAAVVAVGAIVVVVVMANGGEKEKPKADAGPATAEVDTTPPPIVSAPKPPPPAPSEAPAPAGTSIDMATAATEAKMVTRAQDRIDKGDYKGALQEIEDYEKIPNRVLLTEKATVLKINALAHVGRRTDALALAMETRDNDKFKDYHDDIEEILVDAGVRQP